MEGELAITGSKIQHLIEDELAGVDDARVQRHIRSLLVEPEVILRPWHYGEPGQKYPCWDVLRHYPSSTGICYCSDGFGPRRPWGLVSLLPGDSMGDDSGWYSSFMEAYFESWAAAELSIWRVATMNAQAERTPISEEMDWDAAWKQVQELRNRDPAAAARYLVVHSIRYGKPSQPA